jgi:hypothetical protein
MGSVLARMMTSRYRDPGNRESLCNIGTEGQDTQQTYSAVDRKENAGGLVKGVDKMSRMLAVICLLVLTSCAEQWVKPGGTADEFRSMQNECTANAFATYPPILRNQEIAPGYREPVVLECEYAGYFQRCYPYGGEYVAPVIRTFDINDSGRREKIRSCFYQNGWRVSAI